MVGKHHDIVAQTKRYKGEQHSFFLDLASWKKFKTKYALSWTKIRFESAGHPSIPKERGIYAFSVELSPGKLPAHGYIMYVGITGQDSDANLYKRYAQYLVDQRDQNGRPAVTYMLSNWDGDLFFNYVSLPNKKVDLHKMEKALLNAVRPPVNKRDFDATISAPRAAIF